MLKRQPMQTTRLLLIEDDEQASIYISEFLKDSGFDVTTVHSATDGVSSLKKHSYDLLLLDINLPDFSGFELLKTLKGTLAIPVIILSAYSDTRSKIMAFRYGAGDYMVKPIDLEELEARIWVQLGRHSSISTEEVDEAFRIRENDIFLHDQPLNLTWTEFEILRLLLYNKNRTVSRERLLQSLSTLSSDRSLDNHIKNIRKKLNEKEGNIPLLKTEYGVGYRLVDES